MKEDFTIYLFNSTHWDREWYQYFQGFRWRLADVGDDLIEKLENNPEFTHFTFDGQTIVLEDYLEVCPENEERLRKLIKDRRILIGPWYVMPDEYIVSGESLIHNMLIGAGICKEYETKPMNYGYICDIFGHTAQMPQIFAGFNIRGVLLGRGTNEEDYEAHFLWEAPDGTRSITFKLPDKYGYGDFLQEIIRRGGETREEKMASLKKLIERERSRSDVPVVLLMDGNDHQPIHTELLEYKSMIEQLYPKARVEFVDLEQMAKELEDYTGMMKTHKGELNDTAHYRNVYAHLITNTLSSRYDIKSQNDICQTYLEKWTGPLTALTGIFGKKPVRKTMYDLAYKYLIQNHPHDSICGCSIDQTHRDMFYRFDQVKEISAEVQQYGIKTLIEEPDSGENMLLSVMNPLPYPRKEAVKIDLWFDVNYPDRYFEPFGYEQINSFYIIDEKGNQVPYKVVGINRGKRTVRTGQMMTGDRHTVVFEADMPACGVVKYIVKPAGNEQAVRYFDSLVTGEHRAENEFTAIEINGDGTLDITDKRTGEKYPRQLTFVDDGEIGDGWFHCAPAADIKFLSTGAPTIVSLLCDTPAKCTFMLEKRMFIPKGVKRNHEFNADIRRSDEYEELILKSRVSLTRHSPMVYVDLTVDNKCNDHRLRLVIPTGVAEDKYFSSEAFCVVERKVSLQKEREMWREACQHEKAMTYFAYKKENNRGLAFVSGGGLHEVGAFDDVDGTLTVTLMRCIGKAEPAQVTVDGQLLGSWDYHFALMPLSKSDTDADLHRASECIAAGYICRDDFCGDIGFASQSFMSLESESGSVCYSTLKPAQDGNGIILRVVNMSGKEDKAKVTFGKDFKEAFITNLAETLCEPASADASSVSFSVSPWQIKTLRIIF